MLDIQIRTGFFNIGVATLHEVIWVSKGVAKNVTYFQLININININIINVVVSA